MLQALSPAAEWNQGDNPFLRFGSTLAIVLVTDEADCSVQAPDCMSDDNGVLYPVARYIDHLRDGLQGLWDREVVMLGVVCVPSAGAEALVYREWQDGVWPAGDILPGDMATAADKEWEFGIGPGCTGEDGMGGFTGQAIPPVIKATNHPHVIPE